MADHDNSGLLAIDVDTDDYAETAAGDTPSVARTFQSEKDFQLQKAGYSAKIDAGNIYDELIKAVPCLAAPCEDGSESTTERKVKLSKKDVQLVGYAVGEMYYDRKFAEIIELARRIGEYCVVDERLRVSLAKWVRRCEERMGVSGEIRIGVAAMRLP